jgi:hypothetical protein
MHGNGFFGHTCGLRSDVARHLRHLGRCPDGDLTVFDLRSAVHGLHGGMGQIGRAVEGLNLSAGAALGIVHRATAVEGKAPTLRGGLGQLFVNKGCIQRACWALLPLHI